MVRSSKTKNKTPSSSDGPRLETRGLKATKWPFTKEQEEHLQSLYPEFENLVLRMNPEFKSHCKEVANWKKAKSIEIMKMPLFSPLIANGMNRKEWEKNILTRAMGIFMSEVSAKELFASENQELLEEKMAQLSTAQPELIGSALRNKVLKELWNSVDQQTWEDKAAATAADIDA
ncbi:hypothetical protein CPB84DRAFT_1753290 [Gymnopilus junonius]|uniref:Uncharacterized protein n=1 Tax=Gymnopilus junonius TaxID=109634 RepID=A0A9P5NA25_GYMJU|nr:hypothetical protein CPB84DRAFT_1753290 [Gymnopilus junonius]